MPRTRLACLALALSAATGTQALEVDTYQALIAETISGLGAETVDVAHLKALQEQLIALGVAGARDYAAASPADAPLMTFVVDRSSDMTAMSLADIEQAWHDGAALAEIGISMDELDHFGPQIGHMDAIIHPATALIALREYEATGDRVHLAQVKDELAEVVEHLAHLN